MSSAPSISEAFNRMCDEISDAWLNFVDGMHDECDQEINEAGPQSCLAKMVQRMLPDKPSAEELTRSRRRVEWHAIGDNREDDEIDEAQGENADNAESSQVK